MPVKKPAVKRVATESKPSKKVAKSATARRLRSKTPSAPSELSMPVDSGIDRKPVQISLFNHKGGVSKTTTAFNLGWMLANKGKRVLLVDCDPQCNLTGMVMGFKGTDDFDAIYKAGGVRNIRDGLAPAFESRPSLVQPVQCEQINGQPNMYLIPGHIGLAEYEVTLGIAQELSGSLVTLQNLPGSIRYLIDKTANSLDIDYVLVDMSPSLGAINQNLLMTSDYFLVPMAPDYFSVMATDSLANVLPKWRNWANSAQSMQVLKSATYPFPDIKTKFLGTVIQKYRLREGNTASSAFQTWINEIEGGVRKRLIPALREANMLLPNRIYEEFDIDNGKPILQMSEFNGLIALSQKYKVPVFALSDDQLEQRGIVAERTKKSMQRFHQIFSDGADKIIKLVTAANATGA
ncbi:hypothetical protein LMG3431_01427 [Achromobacter pestifer]|uniref:AAA domain-containing protein n=2 Tax=Achromobacter pestifer TaxID=1353889 RepID=A0A6S6Z9E6_9BURK|nr:hypothetical protein LMG3431_01427 [Achromobacter pestifer]